MIDAITTIPIRWTPEGECPINPPDLTVQTTAAGSSFVRLSTKDGWFIIVHRAQLEQALAVVREATR